MPQYGAKMLQWAPFAASNPEPADSLPNYGCRIPEDWADSGTTVGALRFWQATGATIVAIRRNLSYIISPGPYAELYGGDTVIFVGDTKAREAVSHFFSGA